MREHAIRGGVHLNLCMACSVFFTMHALSSSKIAIESVTHAIFEFFSRFKHDAASIPAVT